MTLRSNVGIGTTAPSAPLHVGNTATTAIPSAVFGNLATTYGLSDTAVGGHLMFAGSARYNGNLTYYPSRSDGKPYFSLNATSSTFADTAVGLLVSGNVGIGTATPSSALHITANAGSNAFRIESGLPAGLYHLSIVPTSPFAGRVNYSFNVANVGATANGLTIAGDGNVGIGSTSPSEKLDLGGGNIKMGFKPFEYYFGSTGAQQGTAYVMPCTGTGFVISVSCYASAAPYVACPTWINASGQVSTFNCTSGAATMACNGVCANMR
jgi:hypothetical protein